MNENSNSTVSFDRMRNMLVRAAEIRESEQQQIFDALDEIHARLHPLESIGSVRKRLSEMPDRSETSALASRLDDAMAKLEAQDAAIAAIGRAVEGIVDKLATPFAQLDGRLDGVAGRFEGVAGRMDGLEDKLANIHRRIDELDAHLDKQDSRVDQVPGLVHGPVRERLDLLQTAMRERVDETGEAVKGHVDSTADSLRRTVGEAANGVTGEITGKLDESTDSLSGRVEENRKAIEDSLAETRDTVDATERLETLAKRLEHVTGRLDDLTTRLDTVEDGFTSRINELGGSIEQSLGKVDAMLAAQPTSESVTSLVQRSNEESVKMIDRHLDEAMATFAELMMGGGAPAARPPAPLPRQARRRNNSKSGKNSRPVEDSEDAELATGT